MMEIAVLLLIVVANHTANIRIYHHQYTTSTTRGFAEPKSTLGLDLGLRLY